MCIGNLTIAGTLNWSGGTIGGPNTSGTLTVLGALNIVGPSSKTLSNQSVVAQAGGTHTGGSLNYVNGCSFTNAAGATFTIDNAQNLSETYFGTYNNLGTLA